MQGLINEIDKSLKEENSENYIFYIKQLNESDLELLDKSGLFIFSFDMWYMMAEWGRIDVKLEDYIDRNQYLLIKSFELAKTKYFEDEDFMWLFGYMLDVFPGNFKPIYDYFKAEKRKGFS